MGLTVWQSNNSIKHLQTHETAGVNIGCYGGLACEKGGQSRQTISAILYRQFPIVTTSLRS